MFIRFVRLSACLLALATPRVFAEERIAPIPPDDFDRLLRAIKPQPGESPWRDIPWLTNVTEARRKSVAEDKPIIIFTAADGSPLART